MKKNWPWALLVLVLALVVSCGGCMLVGVLLFPTEGFRGLPRGLANTVAIIPVQGEIVYGRRPQTFGETGLVYSEQVIGEIKRASEDPTIGAIVLEVSSPGGGVVASVDIYEALKACPKPVVTSMGQVAASGGYYIACGAEYIYARPATLTGSIGVISRYMNAQELLSRLGIDTQIIKTGPYKDQGSWHRELTEEELDLLQAMLDEAYEAFIAAVVEGRGLSEAAVRRVADGRILTGRQAVGLGLVDAEGNLEDAIRKAADLAGIEGEPNTMRFERPASFLDLLRGLAAAGLTSPEERLLNRLRADALLQPEYLYVGSW
ncbi:MAG: signal peptide peptidase SppA [Chloroflexi bacterium]|nr:signal peptide peptidase SppA [Chloroflexota bacterium]